MYHSAVRATGQHATAKCLCGSALQWCTQVIKNAINVLAGNTAALAILSWVVSEVPAALLRH